MENRGRRGGVGGSVYRTHWKRRMGKEGKCHVPSHPITVSHSWKERERERVFFVHCPMVTVRPFSNAQRTLPPSFLSSPPMIPYSHIYDNNYYYFSPIIVIINLLLLRQTANLNLSKFTLPSTTSSPSIHFVPFLQPITFLDFTSPFIFQLLLWKFGRRFPTHLFFTYLPYIILFYF